MNIITTSSVATAAAIPLAARSADQPSCAAAILRAAILLLPPLEGGRQISTSGLGAAMSSCFGGIATAGLVERRIGLQLANGLILRRRPVMNDYRVELSGFTDAMVPRLKALGLVSEIISWKLRLFIPTGAQGPTILAMLLDRHSLFGVTDRTAAA